MKGSCNCVSADSVFDHGDDLCGLGEDGKTAVAGRSGASRAPGADGSMFALHNKFGTTGHLHGIQRETMARPIDLICAPQLMSAEGAHGAVKRAGCQDKTHCAGNARWRKYAAASAPRRPAPPSSDSGRGGSRALGSRMPRPAAGDHGLTRDFAYSASSSTNGKRPGCTCGTSGPCTQRSRAETSITSTLSHPVSARLPRLTAGPRGAVFLLPDLLQHQKRKGPLPYRERALSCGN